MWFGKSQFGNENATYGVDFYPAPLLKKTFMTIRYKIITPAHPIIECFILAYHSFDLRILSFNYKLN